jgi:hypothetical protein
MPVVQILPYNCIFDVAPKDRPSLDDPLGNTVVMMKYFNCYAASPQYLSIQKLAGSGRKWRVRNEGTGIRRRVRVPAHKNEGERESRTSDVDCDGDNVVWRRWSRSCECGCGCGCMLGEVVRGSKDGTKVN